MEPYSRTCPRCQEAFLAVTERGICPQCQLLFRAGRDGELIVLVNESYQGNLPNYDPRASSPLASLFEALEFGGGPVVTAARYDGFPSLAEVHRQLLDRFYAMRDEFLIELPESETTLIEDPSSHPDWIGTRFAAAQRLHLLTWFFVGERFDLVCSLTDDGGSIEAVPPDAQYHLPRK